MEIANAVNQEAIKSISLQAEIIRQIQANDGQTPCYATSAIHQCDKKECGWRHDCFDEVHEYK